MSKEHTKNLSHTTKNIDICMIKISYTPRKKLGGRESEGVGIIGFMFAGVPLQRKSGWWRWLQASEILDGHFTPSSKNDSVPHPPASQHKDIKL